MVSDYSQVHLLGIYHAEPFKSFYMKLARVPNMAYYQLFEHSHSDFIRSFPSFRYGEQHLNVIPYPFVG